jgi:hypothetical protein
MKPRNIVVDGEIAYVPLTRGKVAVIDAECVSIVEATNWHLVTTNGLEYAACAVPNQRPKKQYLHRAISGAPDGMCVDHIDGNGLNNRKSNIRIVTGHQNQFNIHRNKKNTSGYPGVIFTRKTGKWCACIRYKKKCIYLGSFSDKQHAANVLDEFRSLLFLMISAYPGVRRTQ